MSGPKAQPTELKSAGPHVVETLSMKLHVGTPGDDYRVAEFWTPNRLDFHIALTPQAVTSTKSQVIILDRREAKALRHWLDAALE